jgi:2-oxoglutarate dehydrogenase E2 component (dihydrolipoamide succinyltransferase)
MADINVPNFPESVTDGTLVAWRKRPGEPVRRGEVVADIETDKVVFEVPAAEDGALTELLVAEGAKVVSGQLLGRIGAAGATVEIKQPAVAMPPASPPEPKSAPSARKLMAEQGLTPAQVAGSGKGGRILKEDVLKVASSAPAPASTPSITPVPKTTAPPPAPQIDIASGRGEKRVPMTRLRARIAERLVQAQHTAAMLTTFNEVNMQAVSELRAKYRERFEKEHGVRLGFMSFFVRACVEALKRFPEVNASLDGSDVVYHGFFDIGIAVSSPRGLVVPVLRDADRMSTAVIEQRIREFGDKAKEARLSLEELTGGTFTITNGGVFGSLLSTPILNPPQSAILGMHKIEERPVAENGQIVIRPMMYVALTYDHRIIDGREAVSFLVMIKELLEDPARLLLEI